MFSTTCLQSFLPNSDACILKLTVSNLVALWHELLVVAHGHKLEQLYKFFFLIVFGLYLAFGKKIHLYLI